MGRVPDSQSVAATQHLPRLTAHSSHGYGYGLMAAAIRARRRRIATAKTILAGRPVVLGRGSAHASGSLSAARRMDPTAEEDANEAPLFDARGAAPRRMGQLHGDGAGAGHVAGRVGAFRSTTGRNRSGARAADALRRQRIPEAAGTRRGASLTGRLTHTIAAPQLTRPSTLYSTAVRSCCAKCRRCRGGRRRRRRASAGLPHARTAAPHSGGRGPGTRSPTATTLPIRTRDLVT